MSTKKKYLVVVILTVLLIGFLFSSAVAEDFPSKTIRLVAAGSVGGGGDRISRIIASFAPEYCPVPMLVITMPGASDTLGINYVIDSKPDGYTILTHASPTMETIGLIQGAFDIRELRGVIQTAVDGYAITVPEDSPFETLNDLIEYARKNPKKVTVSNAGIGYTSHLNMVMFERHYGIQLTHVPYEGGAGAILALLSGDVDATCSSISSLVSAAKGGYLRLLAIGDRERDSSFPEVPTLIELGYEKVFAQNRGIYVPVDTPQEVVDYLEDLFTKILNNPSYLSLAEKLEFKTFTLGADDFTKMIYERWDEYKPLLEEMGMIKK